MSCFRACALILLAAPVAATLPACSRDAGQRPSLGGPVVSEWVPVVKELQARGVADPVMLVGVLATYDLPLASGQKVWGRLPKAFTTVAAVLDRDVAALRTEFVARSAAPGAAATLLSDLKALAPKLDGLPGVNGPPRFDGPEPAQMVINMRGYAAREGVPIPATSRASADWIPLVHALRARGFDDPDVVQFVLLHARLRLRSGTVVDPLDEDARYLTVATAFGLDPAKYRQEFFERMMQAVPGGPNPIPKAKEARAVLATLPEVASIEEVPMELPPEPVKQYRDGDELVTPPWEAFPEPPTSLRWRMGAGEDFLDSWLPFWRGLPESVRRDYLHRHPPPAVWRAWLSRIEAP